MATTSRLVGERILPWVAAAMLAAGLTACGGTEDDAKAGSSPSSPGSARSDAGGSDAGESLPDGFPEDVPLPEHNEIRSATRLGDTGWRLMLAIDLDDDARLDAYAARLADAGFEVETAPPNIMAKDSSWLVDAVVRAPTITLQVLKR